MGLWGKLSIISALFLVLIFAYHEVIHNAYENGKTDGSKQAWIAAEEEQKKQWAQASELIQKRQEDQIKAAQALWKIQQAFDKKAAADRAKIDTSAKQADLVVEKVEQELASPDGLSPAADIMDALQEVVDAYNTLKVDLKSAEEDYDESVELRNKAVAEGRAQAEALQAQLDQANKELSFYENAFHAETKHGGFGHAMKRIFTLGIAK